MTQLDTNNELTFKQNLENDISDLIRQYEEIRNKIKESMREYNEIKIKVNQINEINKVNEINEINKIKQRQIEDLEGKLYEKDKRIEALQFSYDDLKSQYDYLIKTTENVTK